MISQLVYDTLDSTRLEHSRLAATGAKRDRWIIRAKRQTAGVGRGANTWHSPNGGLWISFDFFHPLKVPSFPLYVGYCLHALLTRSFGLRNLTLKWPNDLYLEDRKLAGILCNYQEQPSRYLISVGLNSNPNLDEVLLELNAAILSDHMQLPISNTYLARLLVQSVCSQAWLLTKPQTYLAYCAARLHGRGRQAQVEYGGETLRGIITGLTDVGYLLVETSAGRTETITHGSLIIL